MSLEAPQTREEIIEAFRGQEGESLAFWNGFQTDVFFRRIGDSWSPAETVRHLIKSTFPVVKALGMPKIVLRIMFGRPRRAPLSYVEYRERYLKALAEGGTAGRFAPSSQTERDLESWRASIMARFTGVNRDLRDAIARWPEKTLDSIQLPHPLVGKLSVREMLFSTLYHHRHHIAVVQRRIRG